MVDWQRVLWMVGRGVYSIVYFLYMQCPAGVAHKFSFDPKVDVWVSLFILR